METSNSAIKTPFKRLVISLCIGQSGNMMALLVPLSLLLTLKFMLIDPNMAPAQFGLTTGFGALFALFANPIGGALSDRTALKFGRRRTWIVLGTLLGSLCLAGVALATNYFLIIVFWCGAQTFFNFAGAAYTALLPDQVEEGKRGTISGIVGLIVPLSPVIGLVVMTLLGNKPLTFKWFVLIGIVVISAAICVIMLKDGQAKFERKHEEKLEFGEALSRVYPSPKKYPIFTWALMTRFFISLAFCANTYNSIMLIKRFHYTEANISSTVTLLSMVGLVFLAVASIFGGIFSDKIRRQKPFIYISSAVMLIGLVLDVIAPNMLYIYIAGILTNLAYGLYLGVDAALIARILPNKEDAAKDYGIMNIANTIPQSIVPFMAPLLLAIGGWVFFFGSLAVGTVICALCAIPIPEMSPKSIEEDIQIKPEMNRVSH